MTAPKKKPQLFWGVRDKKTKKYDVGAYSTRASAKNCMVSTDEVVRIRFVEVKTIGTL